jgi:hypothetical protein
MYNLDFHQTYFKIKTKTSIANSGSSVEYSDYKELMESYSTRYSPYSESEIARYDDMSSIYNNTFYMFIGVFICIILALIFTIFSILPIKDFEIFKKLGFIFHIVIFILILVTSIYFFISFDNYLKDDLPETFLSSSSLENIGEMSFWYSYKEGGIDYSMGPGLGWYFMFIICFLSIFAAIFTFLNRQPWIPKYNPSQISPSFQSAYPPMDNYSNKQNYGNMY